jgi:hypothetical protein
MMSETANLSNFAVGGAHGLALAACLAKNTVVKTLLLADARLSQAGLVAVLKAVETNKTIQCLDVRKQ